jgi:hypothetical protein
MQASASFYIIAVAGVCAPPSWKKTVEQQTNAQWHLDRAAEEIAAAERSAHDNAARAHSKLAFLHNVRARELAGTANPLRGQ